MAEAKQKASTQFFERWDGGLLIRQRHERAVPEVFRGKTKTWDPFPQFDPYHKDESIDADTAVELARQQASDDSIGMGDLESTGDTGNAGDLHEAERVPLRP